MFKTKFGVFSTPRDVLRTSTCCRFLFAQKMNFSLYRGNLHKVPDVPRRWALAKPSISLQVFQKAIAKRREAIERLRAFQADTNKESDLEALHSMPEGGECNPPEQARKRKREDTEVLGMEIEADEMKPVEDVGGPSNERKPRLCCNSDPATAEGMTVAGMECDMSLPDVTCDAANPCQTEDANVEPGGVCAEQSLPAENNSVPMAEKDSERLEAPRTPAAKDEECAKPTEIMARELDGCVPQLLQQGPSRPISSSGLSLVQPLCPSEGMSTHVVGSVMPEIVKRKVEIQEVLKKLQETKHQLVQILKQVLMNEEESKRKNQLLQYPAAYATGGTLDPPLEQKVGSEMHSADLEEGELEYTRNPLLAASSYGSHFSAQASTTFVRQFVNPQLSNKP